MRFHIITYGCQMNVCDSDWLSRALRSRGWKETGEEDAQVVILNTCSVREKPETKVYSQIGRYRDRWENDPDFFVAVGGCVAQQVGKELWSRFPYVRLVFGTDGLIMVPNAMDRLAEEPGLRTSFLDFQDYYPERETFLSGSDAQPSAFVNIMQGCNNFCAYCIVPYVRGRQKSRRSTDVIRECRELLDQGVQEITLLGQNVNSYGQDPFGDSVSFSDLLKKVAHLDGLKRLRFTTSHPKDLDPDVIQAFSELPVLCPHLHLPLQSGSDRILAEMRRKYSTRDYLEKVTALQESCPGISLSTDLIVGFPGETDDDFQKTLEMIHRVGFESSFSFKYCDRPGVRAEKMDGKVDEQVKSERLRILQELQENLTRKKLSCLVGTEQEVLIHSRSVWSAKGSDSWQGRDRHGRIIHVRTNG
ncbi:MAG: tRNA (N6-isopentenyl adenosine(37)-C2)-methylthiotransferase MiaB, partial [Desulfovibrionales bacterium]